jgi:hypothetical protein
MEGIYLINGVIRFSAAQNTPDTYWGMIQCTKLQNSNATLISLFKIQIYKYLKNTKKN